MLSNLSPYTLIAEIDRVQTGSCEIDGTKMADVCSDKPVKMSQKVLIPVKENPKVCYYCIINF